MHHWCSPASVMQQWWRLQGFVYIKNDKDMVDPETGTASLARNTNLNEDLGKVEYVFSDKTGTLTANEMQLREVAIAGVAYGDASFRSAPLAGALLRAAAF